MIWIGVIVIGFVLCGCVAICYVEWMWDVERRIQEGD